MAKQLHISREILTKALNRKRFAWVDEVMREVLPPDIYGSIHSESLTDRQRATGWLHEHGYRIKDAGEGLIQIFQGTRLVRQTKLILELTDPQEFISVIESTEHVRIPPPPWQPKHE